MLMIDFFPDFFFLLFLVFKYESHSDVDKNVFRCIFVLCEKMSLNSMFTFDFIIGIHRIQADWLTFTFSPMLTLFAKEFGHPCLKCLSPLCYFEFVAVMKF